MTIEPLQNDESELLWEFLRIAAGEASVERVQSDPQLARYAQNWAREGDFGALAREGEAVIGACWARLFSLEEHGYGWISAEIPEISLAVRQEHQGRGVGRALLENITEVADALHLSLSLSVRLENEVAQRLYRSCGFEELAPTKVANRSGTSSITMLRLAS
jgi:ribosomal protein S18 acetylase RimI-like enzyme